MGFLSKIKKEEPVLKEIRDVHKINELEEELSTLKKRKQELEQDHDENQEEPVKSRQQKQELVQVPVNVHEIIDMLEGNISRQIQLISIIRRMVQ